MNVDGVEVHFEPNGERRFAVLADGRLVGHVELAGGGTGLFAYRADGRALEWPSRWGGTVTARFSSRELAARALLER